VHRAQSEHFTGPFRRLAVPGTGHWPHLEDPGGVIPEIVGFLRA
jgi:pimeloyl-ACP methyl ester carboxylesterase